MAPSKSKILKSIKSTVLFSRKQSLAVSLKCLIVVLLSINQCLAQTEEGSLDEYLNEIIEALPGHSGQDYDEPNQEELEKWEFVMQAMVKMDLNQARIHAEELDYKVTEFNDIGESESNMYYILEDAKGKRYWGTYVFNASPCRSDLILQAPHPSFDTNTGLQAVYSFSRLSAAALFVSGTHRCNRSFASSCSGTTTVCTGTNHAYRITDMAHNDAAAFQVATQVVAEELPEAVFIQFHGFAKQETDPYVILSNGSRETPVVDYAVDIQEGLLLADGSLTFKIGHIDKEWERLLAFNNTQGRFLNESEDPCNADATTNSGRFLHIEQEKSKLRENEAGWNKMVFALSRAFECVEVSNNEDVQIIEQVQLYPNPFSDKFIIEGSSIAEIKVYNLSGLEVFSVQGDLGEIVEVDLDRLDVGAYIVKVQDNQNTSSHLLVKQR